MQHYRFLVVFRCKHYREKIITLLPASSMIPHGGQGCFRSSCNPVGYYCPSVSLNMKSFAMYCSSVELSVQYDGQTQSESEHSSLINEQAHLILWQTGPTCGLKTGFAPVVRLHDKHTRSVLFGNVTD